MKADNFTSLLFNDTIKFLETPADIDFGTFVIFVVLLVTGIIGYFTWKFYPSIKKVRIIFLVEAPCSISLLFFFPGRGFRLHQARARRVRRKKVSPNLGSLAQLQRRN